MDFRKLTQDELVDFLNMHNIPPQSTNLSVLAQQAEDLFTDLQDDPYTEYTEPVADLYLAELFLQSGEEIPQKYYPEDIQNMTPDQKSAFGQALYLEAEEPDFTRRLLRILDFLGALESTVKTHFKTQFKPEKLWNWNVGPNQPPIPISYPVNKSYPIDKIIAWRKWIGQESGMEPDLSNYTLENVKKIYRLYNKHFFNNSLPTLVNFEISGRLTRVAGKCGPCPGKECECRFRIKMSRPIFERLNLIAGQKTESGGVECETRLECFQLVLEHEIMHLAIKFMIPYKERKGMDQRIYSAHGLLFKDLLQAYYGQSRSTHSIGKIIMDDEEAEPITKASAQVGQPVYYIKGGEPMKGVITVTNPANAIIKLLNGDGRIIKYKYLNQVPEDDDDIDALNEMAADILEKYNYFRRLRKEDEVRYKVSDQIIVGNVVTKAAFTFTTKTHRKIRYTILVLPGTGKDEPEKKFMRYSEPIIQRTSKVDSGDLAQKKADAIRSGLKLDDLVRSDYDGEPKYGIIMKRNPKYAIVYTLDKQWWNMDYNNISKNIPDVEMSRLIDLFNQVKPKRDLYSRLQVGDEIKYQAGGFVEMGTVTKLFPRTEQLATSKHRIRFTDLIV